MPRKPTTSSLQNLRQLVHKLNQIGILLSAEKNVDNLMLLILDQCMQISCSDGGSIYIREEDANGEWITFKYTRNHSRDFPFNEFVLPISDTSFAGYCAMTGKSLNFPDIRDTEKLIGIRHNDVFDRMNQYCTCNMLVIPMKNYSGEVIGVMQLINKKKDFETLLTPDSDYEQLLTPYTEEEEEIITSLASQAAILLERTTLYEEVEELFKTFIESMVTALDKRDPVTAGHSKRVADYAVALAKSVNEVAEGPYAEMDFTEEQLKKLYYSGLLHDIGKVGVEEYLLIKSSRLSAHHLDSLAYRFGYLKQRLLLQKHLDQLAPEDQAVLDALDDWLAFIRSINDRGYMAPEEIRKVQAIAETRFTDIDGHSSPLLTDYERDALCVVKGNLTREERRKIEQHPEMTFEVLHDISWSEALKEVPIIAACHHEKLDGQGYPKGLKGRDIPMMAKILAIVDIFDAMTAKDRPYKRAVPVDKTLEILLEEAKGGHIDGDLVQIFSEKEAWRPVFEGSVSPAPGEGAEA